MTHAIEEILDDLGPCVVAVSGGVDSMTLAVSAARYLGRERVSIVHAISAAVPPEATLRVEAWADRENWHIKLIDAGEFGDENYRSNPVDRCFFCKGNLYGAIAARADATILSGTNMDDLGEYRPGLVAAARHGVRHPFVEARMDKAAVRALARELSLGAIAELPASPCLSSRVETSIRIEPALLHAVHAIERLLTERLKPATVRCRLRRSGIVIELDAGSLTAAGPALRNALTSEIADLLPGELAGSAVAFAPYRNGGAFLRGV